MAEVAALTQSTGDKSCEMKTSAARFTDPKLSFLK